MDNPDTGNHILTETNISAAPGSNCPAGSTDPRCTPVTTVLTPALTIVQDAQHDRRGARARWSATR